MEANTWKGTKGKNKVKVFSWHGTTEFWFEILDCHQNYQESEENAKLFTDALKTIQKCGKMPSELLEHNELLKQQFEEAKKKIPF